MALSAKADGIIVVTRLRVVRRPMLKEIRRLLDVAPAAKLGFVLTGVEAREMYGGSNYGYLGSQATPPEEEPPTLREVGPGASVKSSGR